MKARDVQLQLPKGTFEGSFSADPTLRQVYATDASVYEEIPLAVACPKSEADIRALIDLSLIHI